MERHFPCCCPRHHLLGEGSPEQSFSFPCNGGGKRGRVVDEFGSGDGDGAAPGKRARRTQNYLKKIQSLEQQLSNAKGGVHPNNNTHSRNEKIVDGFVVNPAPGHPRKDKQGRFITTREGEHICFKYGAGKCELMCPRGMAHVCQRCLAPHQTSKCPKKSAPAK